MILPTTLYNRVLTIFAVVILLIIIGLSLAWCGQRGANQKRDAVVAKTTGRALDKVAEQTPVIRQEQKEKENEVSAIEGSDARLPDGFGADLERVRRGKRD
jgi:septal ring-binding cell division protein DamX